MTEEDMRLAALDQAVQALGSLPKQFTDRPYKVLNLASLFEAYIKQGWVVTNEQEV